MIVFNIKDFYSSIKETLLIKAINFAKKRVNIKNEDKVIIKYSRKSLLYNNSKTSMKKSHTCEEGGVHLRFFFLTFIDELEKQIIITKTVEVGQ